MQVLLEDRNGKDLPTEVLIKKKRESPFSDEGLLVTLLMKLKSSCVLQDEGTPEGPGGERLC